MLQMVAVLLQAGADTSALNSVTFVLVWDRQVVSPGTLSFSFSMSLALSLRLCLSWRRHIRSEHGACVPAMCFGWLSYGSHMVVYPSRRHPPISHHHHHSNFLASEAWSVKTRVKRLQGYLAHKIQPLPLGLP